MRGSLTRGQRASPEGLTVLNPGRRRTAEPVSNGNGRKRFILSDGGTAGTAGCRSVGMRLLSQVGPEDGGTGA